MSHGGIVQYDYAGIAMLTGQLTVAQHEAEGLRATGQMHRVQMQAVWTGTASGSFDDAYQRFDSVQASTIETLQSTIVAINSGSDGFHAGEAAAAAAY